MDLDDAELWRVVLMAGLFPEEETGPAGSMGFTIDWVEEQRWGVGYGVGAGYAVFLGSRSFLLAEASACLSFGAEDEEFSVRLTAAALLEFTVIF